jgi:hypothetical protein
MTPRSYAVVEVAATAPSGRERFRRWVNTYGVRRLARSLDTDRRTVNLWIQEPPANIPVLPMVKKIIAHSTLEPFSDGPLSYEDIFGSVKIVSHVSHSYSSKLAPRQVLTRRAV